MRDDLDEPVHLVAYDPNWPRLYREESARLRSLAPFISMVAIEHFGSTAVPGMAAKPVIDVLIGVQKLPIAPGEIQKFEQAGYEYLGEAGVAGRLYFRKRGIQDFNLAVVVFRERHWKENLLLRDYLRGNPAAAAEYEREKRQAIARGTTALLAYSEAKSDCISGLLASARRWWASTKSAG